MESLTLQQVHLSTSGFLDDNNFRRADFCVENVAALLCVAWNTSEMFNVLSGTHTNFVKTCCFASTAALQRLLDLQGRRGFSISFKVVTVKGQPSIAPRDKRVKRGVARLPVPDVEILSCHRCASQHYMLQLSCLSLALHGRELLALTAAQNLGLRRAVSAAVFKDFFLPRAPALATTLLLPGHRLDAKPAGIYNAFCLARRRRQDLRTVFEEAWHLLWQGRARPFAAPVSSS